MKAIYLTGFMGAGKSTIGRELGKALYLPVIDTDDYIEKNKDKKVRDIFETEGETTFRTYEREALKELPTEDVIITTGGGMVTQQENREWLLSRGTIIYLHCDFDIIVERLKYDSSRPLFDHEQLSRTEKLFHDRLPLYQEAHYTINTSNKEVNDIVNEIMLEIKK
ncbi:shikimate kinase [Bacillus luteolus]|uniref:Shikimate kinase n=1 Tax=Litchfieldia luteola TaxID=682179 RepID=A0ABR9QHH4_9BACI|nr:shikimate kinase [Cytobacillus luteolus]MBE4907946.1 shikimate kinase [Cytobacillus luteolus]MBP1942725.1 shikimate kinase [Cytobacillus luteolus]